MFLNKPSGVDGSKTWKVFTFFFQEFWSSDYLFSVPSQPGENRGECFAEFESRLVKTREALEDFHLLENSYKLCRGFQQAMKAGTTCFISFIKLLFSLLTKTKTIYEARTVNSHNSETVKPHCSRHFRAS